MQATDRHQDDAGIAQRYLAGQLSPPEQEEYEQYFIRNPDAVRELEATARMKVGLASLRDKGQLDSLLQGAPTTSRRAALMAIAASVAVIAIAVGLWREVRVPDGAALVASATRLVDSSGKPLAVGAIYAVMRTRATDYDAVVTLPAVSGRTRHAPTTSNGCSNWSWWRRAPGRLTPAVRPGAVEPPASAGRV